VNDILPNGYTYVGLPNSYPNGNYDANTGVWTVGDLAGYSSGYITIEAIVNPTGEYKNTACITSDQSASDYNTVNNCDSAVIEASWMSFAAANSLVQLDDGKSTLVPPSPTATVTLTPSITPFPTSVPVTKVPSTARPTKLSPTLTPTATRESANTTNSTTNSTNNADEGH